MAQSAKEPFDAPKGYDRGSDMLFEGAPADARVRPAEHSVLRGGLTENFDDVAALPSMGWALQNNSDPVGVTSWFQGNPAVFPSQAGADTSYIGANFNNTSGVGTISNWLVTPEVALENGTEMTFFARASDGNFPDRLQVRLSTAGASTDVGTGATDVGDFTELLLDINPNYEQGVFLNEWTEYTVTVDGLSGPTTGRLAFRYFVENAGPSGSNSDYIGIDEVSVSAVMTGGPTAGGPDAFGYTWVSSANPEGPVYNFMDISETGTLLEGFNDEACTFGDLDEGNVDVSLPWQFPFYGGMYSQVTVNINGLILVDTPEDVPCAFGNDAIPDTGTPNGGLIAPLWDDFNITPNTEDGPTAGNIYVQAMNSFAGGSPAFVIQYDMVERFGGAQNDLVNTFQAVLFPDGNILYQYGELQGTSFSPTIGIENLDGTDGLQVINNEEFAEDGLAVLMVAPSGGGDQVSLPITFEDDIDYELVDFGGASSTLVVDPEDATNTAVETVRPDAAECFAGTTVANATGFDMPIPFEPGETKMNVRVWSPAAGVRVRFKVEKFDDPTISVEADEFTTVAGAWETLEYDFVEDQVPNTAPINFDAEYTKASIFFNFQCDVPPTMTPTDTYYWDDIRFGGVDMPVPDVELNEFRTDQSGADDDEFFEITGEPGTALDGLTLIVIGDGDGGQGVIENVTSLNGQTIPASGFFVAAEGTFSLGTADFTTDINFENGQSSTFVLVSGFSGMNGDDLDTDDDGTPDVAPWSEIVDAIGISSGDVDDIAYGAALGFEDIGPDGDFAPGMFYRAADTGNWIIGAFDLGVDDTPGAMNPNEPVGGGELSFSPSPLVEMLNVGETGSETVTLTNNTEGDISFDFSQYSGENLDKAPPTSGQPSLELDKGADDPRGYVQSFGAGGPDEFGYSWIDSNEPGGPAFEEIDISGTGTELVEADFDSEGCTFGPLDEGNALVELPFSFPFYGENYSSVKVNINGHLNFNADGAELPCAFTNDPLPDAGDPNGGIIAPLWDDFNAEPAGPGGGQIFYEELADGRFVVQYHNIERFGSANDGILNTFQVILSPSGAIKYQYVDFNDTNPSYSIGIENPDGTIGLEVAMGSGYVENGLAVQLSAAPPFVTGVTPATGTIPAGGTADVDVDFSAEGLNGGTYEGTLIVETDLESDPSTFELPVVLEVTGMAACAITPDPVEFDDVIVGFSTSEEVTVSNGGSDSCELTGASADAPFSVEGFESTTLEPGGSTSFTVVYTPTAAGDDSGTLTVTTDADDLTAGLEGTGLEPPSFSVDPTSLDFEVVAGTVSDAQTLTLSNSGAGAGEFSISVANATRRGLTPSLDQIDPVVTLNAPETAALLAQIEDKPIVNARSGVTVSAKPGSHKLSATTQSSVLRGGGPGDLIASTTSIASISGFGQTPDGTIYVCDLNAGATTETFTFDGSSFTSTGSFTQPGTPGTNITGCAYFPDGNSGDGAIWFLNANLGAGTATFIETDLAGTPTGATVPVTGLNAGAVPIGLSYSEATGQFFLLDISADDIVSIGTDGAVVNVVPQTCLDDGSGLFGNALDALGGALDVAVGTSVDARPTRIQVTEFDGTCRGDGQGNDLFTPITVTEDAFINAVLRDRSAPNEAMFIGANSDFTIYAVVPAERDDIGSFLIVEPEEGTVDAGGDQEISVTVDATDLEVGSYSADIVIATNDPANPTITVPVTVEVVATPANEGEGVPTEFALGQNYPNPFASRTTIDYALPEAARVTITVYDAVGRRVAVLVDEDVNAGYHSADWDTRGLASGVYLYRIQAGDYAKTRKMSIVR